jgi:hypothetical protein
MMFGLPYRQTFRLQTLWFLKLTHGWYPIFISAGPGTGPHMFHLRKYILLSNSAFKHEGIKHLLDSDLLDSNHLLFCSLNEKLETAGVLAL